VVATRLYKRSDCKELQFTVVPTICRTY